jgi:hypothetical protein
MKGTLPIGKETVWSARTLPAPLPRRFLLTELEEAVEHRTLNRRERRALEKLTKPSKAVRP